MTQNKKTKQAAFKAYATEEEELIKEIHNLIHTYETEVEESKKHDVFEKIVSICSTILMKSMQLDPLQIIENLDEIQRAVEIIKPKLS
jgi:hypothetical protein